MIRNKAQFYSLYEKGVFGNKLLSWPNVQAWAESGFKGRVGLRYNGLTGMGFIAYDLEPAQVFGQVDQWLLKGADYNLIRPGESAPDSSILFQGEVQRSTDYLDLFWSPLKTQMRVALKEGQPLSGLPVVMKLRQAMTPASYDDLSILLEEHPGAVVEFGVYDHNLGSRPGRNTLIWEVRNY